MDISAPKTRTDFPSVFGHFDEEASRNMGRTLTEDEKAIAHTAIVDAFQVARRERIPFSAAFEKTYPTMPARREFSEVYEALRRKRGHIERLLERKPASLVSKEAPPALPSSPISPLPLMGLHLALGNQNFFV